jgi:hypothetical protein
MKASYALAALLGMLAVLAITRPAQAAVGPFLSGVVSYGADATGGSVTEPAEFDNINGSGNFAVAINGQPRGTTFPLSLGLNDFTFSGVSGGFNALSLYFAPSGAAFSRPFASTPDLVGYTPGTGALTPVAGAQVQTNGQFSGTVPWSGASIYNDGLFDISFTQFTFVNTAGTGTFQLQVTSNPTPEPTALAPLALAGAITIPRRRRARPPRQRSGRASTRN